MSTPAPLSTPPELSLSLPSTANKLVFIDDQGNIDTLDASSFQHSITSYLREVKTHVDSELDRFGSGSLNDITSSEVDRKIESAIEEQWKKICLPPMQFCRVKNASESAETNLCHLCCSGEEFHTSSELPFYGRCK